MNLEKKVAIIHENMDFISGLSEIVQNLEYTPISMQVSSNVQPQNVVNFVQENDPYAVLMAENYDNSLSGEGVVALKEIRKRDRTLPILMVSSCNPVHQSETDGLNAIYLQSVDYEHIKQLLDAQMQFRTKIRELTALIVEDEMPIASIFKKIFNKYGITNVDSVESTTEGLQKLNERNYDFVFTDLRQQPSGIEVFAIAVQKGVKQAYIMSGYALDIDNARAIAGNNFINKPFNLGKIEKIIESYIQQYKPQS